jgi:hypothetical protein
VSQFDTLWQKNPDQFKSFVTKLVQPPAAPTPFTLNPGDVRFDANGKQIAAVAPKPPETSLQSKDVLVDGQRAVVNFNPRTGEYFAPGTQTPLANVKPIPPQSSVTVQQGVSDAKSIADSIVNGEQPPELTGLYRLAGPVRAELAKQGYNLTNALTDWRATQKHVATLNGAKITQMQSAISTASDSLDVIDNLASQWKGGKFPILNKANLALAKNGAYGKEAQSIATQLDGQITDVVSELGQVYMGGNSPTDHALGLAEKNLKADWSEDVLKDMTKLARTNLQIRKNSILHSPVSGTGTDNAYDQTPKNPPTKVEEWVIDPKSGKLVKKGGG